MSIVDALLRGDDVVRAARDLDPAADSAEEQAERAIERARAVLAARAHERLAAALDPDPAGAAAPPSRFARAFVAGWRPAVGWVGVAALAYQFIVYPVLLWLPWVHTPPPPLDSTMLYSLVTGMLGIAGLRSFDKTRGVDTKRAW
jgi:hypothetical protein